jgi:hypothetical protein
LIATICILALAGYFKLKNSDVFYYALGVIVISFAAFLFSLLLKVNDLFIRILLYALLTCVIIVFCAAVLGFGYFIFTGQPKIYLNLYPDKTPFVKTDTVSPAKDLRQVVTDSMVHDTIKTFSLNFHDVELIAKLKSSLGMRSKAIGADFPITLTYDHNKFHTNKSAHSYGADPGSPVILVNGEICCWITEFSISGQEDQTDKQNVLDQLRAGAAATPISLINKHINQIISCIKQQH